MDYTVINSLLLSSRIFLDNSGQHAVKQPGSGFSSRVSELILLDENGHRRSGSQALV